ncbi:sporulation-specific protein 15 isoform X1 [Lucilia cuprina]|uniref:sporulation-specific protein 15 isoform X1 n=1 Tax=Lucilia cuprina TaxID=7375 RepID=UPI001F051901|nr:sporulation-specific protein 15 isoform X1 [Lucilia cuprina]XP_046807538.1 sporulation-specific protein 15 isoform X1 [Lucilia cuprina]XP_046807539.1 sporulation-specific protein 15 isoform X1 [Lucilia cuprina]XP_046807540.1 sporulation-specific protein 15 isoform X1 [Lucilia cuprina]
MSAILFNSEQDLNSTSSTHNDSNTSIDNNLSSTYHDNESQKKQKLDRPCSAIYEDILDSKMNGLKIHADAEDEVEPTLNVSNGQNYCDGSDSGVEITNNVNVTLQRALSNQSGGYASSTQGGMDDTTQGINLSCNSSMISCSSDVYDLKQPHSLAGTNINGCRSSNNYECCSENGSESSSIAGHTTMAVRRVNNHNNVKKKVAMFEPSMHESLIMKSKSSSKDVTVVSIPAQQQNRPRLSGLKRAVSLPRPTQGTAQQVRERLSDKMHNNSKINNNCLTPYRSSQPRTPQGKPQKPETLPSQLSRTTSMSMQRLIQRTPSLSRARTPSTPDDGRWPGVTNSRSTTARRGLSVTPDLSSAKMRSSMMASMEIKSSSSSPYGTLPRRRKQKSVEDLTGRSSRSSSITRESRMTSSVIMTSRKSLATSYATSSNNTPTQHKTITSSLSLSKTSSLRKPQTPSCKTRIYHETGSQTALTNNDIEKAFAGVALSARSVESVEQKDQETHAEIRDQEMERLRDEVRHLAQREQDLTVKLKREREEKLAMQRELHMNTEKVMGLLNLARIAGNGKMLDAGTPTSDEGESNQDSLLMLESQIQMSGHELIERQQEVGQLRKLCRSLQAEMERSLMQQECLMQEKAAIEQESSELQDFLQHEKAAMCDALKDLETEYQQCQQQLSSKDEEVKVLRDECRHLVRLNEQRRQENRLLQTKYAALESKSKELIMQQNASVSGATAALSGLHARLDNLVEQLVFSYNISEQDLEDIGFQNDTQTNVSASGENSLDCETSSVKLTLNGHEVTQTQQHPQTLNFAQAQNHNHHHHHTQFQLNSASDGSLSPQRNQSFIAAVISAIRNATTHSGKRLLVRHNKRHSAGGGNGGLHHHHQPHQHNQLNMNSHNNNHQQNINENNGDDSDSTEMLDSETEPCLMMDNVLEDVPMPDSHSHNMVSSCTGMISQIEIPSEILNVTTADESLQNLSQAIVNRQNMESQVNVLGVHKMNFQLNDQPSCTEEMSCHDSVAEMPSLVEYSATQAVVDQVIEVDSLVTKLLKVLRLIQLDNDNCIQQLIMDKNKLQQNKEDMLEKIKDLQDVNVKLQDELMDATQELMLKNNDLSNTKAEIQRHRNEIDRLTEDICNLSTLCSNYRKLSPSTELPQFPNLNLSLQTEIVDNQDEIGGIINLLKMWQADGQLKDNRIQQCMANILELNSSHKNHNNVIHPLNERLRIYANQLENILTVLNTASPQLIIENPALQQLHKDLEIVKLNANWSQLLNETETPHNCNEDINAN